MSCLTADKYKVKPCKQQCRACAKHALLAGKHIERAKNSACMFDRTYDTLERAQIAFRVQSSIYSKSLV